MLEGRVAGLPSNDHITPPQSTPAAASNGESTLSIPCTPDERDGTSDLSSRVGMLDFRTTQIEPQYLGSSSSFAFSRILNLSLSSNLPTAPTLAHLSDRRSSPSPCLLPDYHVAVRLSGAYFKTWEAMLYDSSLDFTVTGFSFTPLFFLNMVYAVAALLTPSTQSLAGQLYISTQLYADVLSKDNIESIQALLCYAMYSLRSLEGPSLWKISGLALWQCIELGYHRGVKQFAPVANILQQEMRKRVFWVAQGIDCTVAVRLGRPLGIPPQEIDAEFPLDLDDSVITETGIVELPREYSSQSLKGMSTAIHVFKLRYIWARIHTSLLSDTVRLSIEDRTYHARIEQLRVDLETWLGNAPEARPHVNDDLSIFAKRAWYETNYSHTILLLYRSQLREYKESLSKVFEHCIEASRSICQTYRRLYIGTSTRYTWGTLHCLFLAGLTYLHCLWTSPAAWGSIRPEDVSKTCTDCTMVLVAIAEGWQAAAPYRDTFEALASRVIAMVFKKNRTEQASLPPPSEAETEDQNQDTWGYWMNDMANAGVLEGVDGLLEGFIGDFTTQISPQ
ncbi:purine utilization positive regulator [Fusarium subglutinans]|uniref:Purine utilization positive regulator n=1 Tax=Gibberella subglutinans TaxID=42677 RepID=A0A8H5UZH5_GIBSU|nr:purine utilization positive regulator [Fusarium subglutinans]KAF5603125.1 purine utilization positive regulator [Fusarium subglutinans]